MLGIGARCGVGGAIQLVRKIVLHDGHHQRGIRRGKDVQIQCDDAVATEHTGVCLRVLARFRVGNATKGKHIADRRVDFSVRNRMHQDVHRRVVGATTGVIYRERVGDGGVVIQTRRRGDLEQRVRKGRHPRSACGGIVEFKFHARQCLGAQRQLPTEDIAVVCTPAVLHLDVSVTVQRTANQTGERIVGMVELRASSHIRGIHTVIVLVP